MTNILIFGHKNPDTDTICSAIVYNNLKRLQGMDTEAVNNYIDAEEYHQKYLEKNPTGYCHVDLSLAKKSL